MKKVMLLIGMIIICFVIAGCSANTNWIDESEADKYCNEKGMNFAYIGNQNGNIYCKISEENYKFTKWVNFCNEQNNAQSCLNYHVSITK